MEKHLEQMQVPPTSGGDVHWDQMTSLFRTTWEAGEVPQDFKDSTIVHIYKRKGDITSCDNHHGILLLYIAGNILARVVLNRLIKQIIVYFVPESQCGFHAGSGTSVCSPSATGEMP